MSAHNKLRRLHKDTGDLKWDADLARKAQAYAEKLVGMNMKSSKTLLVHSKSRGLGENLFWKNGKTIGKCAQASYAW